MFKFSFLKLFARTIFYKILEYIFFFRSLKNCLKLIVNDNIDNFYAPNLFIKNIIFIDPMKIEYKNSIPVKFRKKSTPIILSFDWDKNNKILKNFENEHHTYVSCRELFIDGIETDECKEFHFFKKQISEKGEWKNCKNENDIKIYFHKLFKLFENIKENGVKTNIDDNLEFMVDSNNNLVKINSGNHRFSISRILKLQSIPVEVKLIHLNCLKKGNHNKISINELNDFIKKIEQKYK